MCRWWQVGWLCLLGYLLLGISVASSTVASSLVLKDQQPTPSVTLVAGYSDHPAQPFTSEQRISSPQQLSSISADSPTAIHFTSSRLIIFIYAGMIILGLHQLFMFLVLRETNYLLLAVYIFSATLALHRVSPIFPELLFLSDASYYFYSAPFFLMLAVYAEFTRRVLDLKDYTPKLNKIYKSCVMLALAFVLLSGLMPKESVFPIIFTSGLLLLSIISSHYIARRGHRIAYYSAWIYWLPVIIHLPGMLFLLVETERFDQSLAALTSIGTLIFMLLLAVLQAERVRMLREHMKQIEAANLAKEQFLAVMSHELRTPMSAIMGLSTLLKLSPLDSKQQNYLQKLDSATEHIMQLLNNVLDYAKVTNYTFQLKPEPCRLSVVVQSTLPLIQPLAEQKGLKLVFENQGELETNLLLDRTCLIQVLLNLLTNAVKYTPEGSVRLQIQMLAAQHQYQQVRFNVSDTGVGFPQELLSYLFEPFTQLTPQNSQQGVGLGLAISKRLVTLMGSELTVQSQVGQGTSISFVVKFLLAPALPQTTTQLDMLTKGLRLLVADNAELNNPETSAMLRQLGANVHVVPNGPGAILCLQEEDVDMVLVDMSLPDLGGLELGRWVRHSGRNPRLPIVALTSNTLTEIEPVCRELGINAYLHKPLDYQSLSTTLNRALAA